MRRHVPELAQQVEHRRLDAGGHAVVLYRQSGSGIARPQIATGKAWGALGLGFSSRGVAGAAARFPEFFNALAAATDGKVVPAPGGVLLRDERGVIVGSTPAGAAPSRASPAAQLVPAFLIS
ncbi:heme-binding protein [Kutzneria buriramensis]|uniref:GlcG/HbpS family heme-binding protein n=1 Tax=Kutzneria buriramensis TaxID=1045776 RepID=UPI0035E75420